MKGTGKGCWKRFKSSHQTPPRVQGCRGCGGKGGILYKKMLCMRLTEQIQAGISLHGKQSSRYQGAQNPRATSEGRLSNK